MLCYFEIKDLAILALPEEEPKMVPSNNWSNSSIFSGTTHVCL